MIALPRDPVQSKRMAKKAHRRSYLVSSGGMVLRLTEAAEGGYVVTSPHDPDLVTQAETIGEAFENAADAARALRQARARLFAQLKLRSKTA
jgi:hypothetical protein